MHFSAPIRSKSLTVSSKASPSPRLLTYRPIEPIDFSPYLDGDKPNKPKPSIFRKVTSTIGGIYKNVRSVVGSFWKPHEEEEIRLSYSQPLMRHHFNKDIVSVNLQNHPINNVNFSDLGSILSRSQSLKTIEQKEVPKIAINGMNISFGGQNKNFDTEFVNQTIISFHPHESFNNGKENNSGLSEQLGNMSPADNKIGKHKKREKVNLIRVLNFCHIQYEHTSEKYNQSCPKSFNVGLKHVLTKRLKKPEPLHVTLPTIEFRYNKVTGKYDVIRLLKKRKRHEMEENEEVSEHESLLDYISLSNKNKDGVNIYKKNKMTPTEKSDGPGILLNFKGTPDRDKDKNKNKGIPLHHVKKTQFFIDNLEETTETDEIEELEAPKTPPKNKNLFEEEKEENKEKLLSQGIEFTVGKRDQSSQTSDLKQSMSKLSEGLKRNACTSPLRSKSLSRRTSMENDPNLDEKELLSSRLTNATSMKDMSYERSQTKSLSEAPHEPMVLSQEDPNTQKLPDQGLKIPLALGDTTFAENSMTDEKKNDLPKTPNFKVSEGGSLFNFMDKTKDKSETSKTDEAEGQLQPYRPFNLFGVKKVEPGMNLFSSPLLSKEEKKDEPSAPVQEKKPESSGVVPSFLTMYQSNAQKPEETFGDNPFLSRKTPETISPFANLSKQESPPTKAEPQLFTTTQNPVINTQTQDIANPAKPLYPIPNLNLFASNVPNQQTNLFASTPNQQKSLFETETQQQKPPSLFSQPKDQSLFPSQPQPQPQPQPQANNLFAGQTQTKGTNLFEEPKGTTNLFSQNKETNLFPTQTLPQTNNLFAAPPQPKETLFNQNLTQNPLVRNLFSENKLNSSPPNAMKEEAPKGNISIPSNLFQSTPNIMNGMRNPDEMERENSVGFQNNLFGQKPLGGGLNLFQSNNMNNSVNNNKGTSLFGDLASIGPNISQQTQNLFQNNQAGPLGQNSSIPLNQGMPLFNNNMTNPQPSGGLNLFGNNASSTQNNQAGSIMGFNQPSNAPSTNLFNQGNLFTNNSSNIGFNGASGGFLGQNNNNLPNQSTGSFMNNNNTNTNANTNAVHQTEDATRFLGATDNSNANTQQGRVFRRIIQPSAKNRDRAF